MFTNKNYLLQKVLIRDWKKIVFNYLRSSSTTTPVPELDLNYLCDSNNFEEISNNVTSRKGIGDIKRALDLKNKLDNLNITDKEYKSVQTQLTNELLRIPNKTHPDVVSLKDKPKLIKLIGSKKEFGFKPREFYDITKRLNLIRTEQLGNVSGSRSYFVLGEMAELEQALTNYTVDRLQKSNFDFISVPDVLDRNIIEGCGLNTRGNRTQVYTLEPKMHGPDLCLSGTSEMAIGGYLMNKTFFKDQLPIKLAAVSRCYRAEVSSTAEERGIYRVHQFTKVEMFAVTVPDQSDQLLEELRSIEEENFGLLGLHLQTLDMPPHELGAPAYRKYDIEAWLPGRNMFGEVSSCSNCTDYQSRRLGIKYKVDNELKYAHTLNGTACAIPRMLIALTETYQTNKGVVEIPEVLQKYMNGKKYIGKQKRIPELKLVKHKK